MPSLALDADGDLAITGGRLRLTADETGETLAQRLRVRLRLWRGEFVLDRRVGIPFRDWLGRKGEASVDLARAVLRRAVASCPGVASVDSFSFSLDLTREARVSFEVTASTGVTVRVDDVFLGGA